MLSDAVRVLRQFQPDVIVTRFSPEGGGTHGHHTASTALALEAFKLAGDPQAFPEQISRDGLVPWKAKRIFWNAFRGAGDAKPLRLDIGGYLPLLGQSLGEISALSRSSHRSQGYGSLGSRGSRPDDFLPLDNQPVGKDFFDGIDVSWTRQPDGDAIARLIDDATAKFNPQEPVASLPALLGIHKKISDLPGSLERSRKLGQLDRIIQDCLGLYVETTSPQAEAVPGETLRLRQSAILRADFLVEWLGAENGSAPFGDQTPVVLRANQSVTRETDAKLPADAPLTQPYWLREEGTPGMYRADDPRLIGQPENPPLPPCRRRRPRPLCLCGHGSRPAHDWDYHRPGNGGRPDLSQHPAGNPLRAHPFLTPPAAREFQSRLPRPRHPGATHRLSARRGRPHGGESRRNGLPRHFAHRR